MKDEKPKKINLGGRPKLYKTVEELQAAIEDYFNSCWDYKVAKTNFGPVMITNDETGEKEPLVEWVQIKPYTIVGLANAIGMTRETLLQYQKDEKYSDTILRAKGVCHQYAEEQLFLNKSAHGPVFNLKNNYGWQDKTQQELSGVDGEPIKTESLVKVYLPDNRRDNT